MIGDYHVRFVRARGRSKERLLSLHLLAIGLLGIFFYGSYVGLGSSQ